jgi:hypothetical protein
MRGFSRDERRGSLQIVYGLLCDRQGRPVAVEVFQRNTIDSQTLNSQAIKLKDRFGVDEAVFVADRGMATRANVEILCDAGVDWITALRARQVQKLAAQGPGRFAALALGAVELSRSTCRRLSQRTARGVPQPPCRVAETTQGRLVRTLATRPRA